MSERLSRTRANQYVGIGREVFAFQSLPWWHKVALEAQAALLALPSLALKLMALAPAARPGVAAPPLLSRVPVALEIRLPARARVPPVLLGHPPVNIRDVALSQLRRHRLDELRVLRRDVVLLRRVSDHVCTGAR